MRNAGKKIVALKSLRVSLCLDAKDVAKDVARNQDFRG